METDGRDESATQPRELTGLVADAGVVGKANASESRMNYDRSVSQPSGTLLVIFCVTSRFYGPSSHPCSRVFLYHRPSTSHNKDANYPSRRSFRLRLVKIHIQMDSNRIRVVDERYDLKWIRKHLRQMIFIPSVMYMIMYRAKKRYGRYDTYR